jgi:hypothetical protein
MWHGRSAASRAKPARMVVTYHVRILIIELILEIVVFLARLATAESHVVSAIHHKGVRSAAVLSQSRALSRDTHRVSPLRVDWQVGFDAQVVDPAIPAMNSRDLQGMCDCTYIGA